MINIPDLLTSVIEKRRSVFPPMFTDDIIDDKLVNRILDSANWAPNHRKTEPWRFVVFSGESRTALSDYCCQWYKENTPAEKFSELKYNKTAKKALQSSHVIAICMHRDPKESVPEWEEIAAVACAVQNMWLTTQVLGLGGYWSSPGSALAASEFLKLEKGQKCLGWFYLGKPKEGLVLNSDRGPIEEKVTWNK